MLRNMVLHSATDHEQTITHRYGIVDLIRLVNNAPSYR